jgi:hypothetical protein
MKETNPMITIRIAADGCEEVTVTLAEFARRIPLEDFNDVSGELVRNDTARINLIDGRRATATWLSAADQPLPTPQTGLPLREYHGDAQLVFELSGHVRVRASSDEEARSIITDVVRRQRMPPEGFELIFNADTATNMKEWLPVRDIHLINLTEQLLLDDKPPVQGAST